MKWEPEDFVDDPVANAILNVAAQLNFCGEGIDSLLYAFKYSKREGMSVSEEIHVAAKSISEALMIASASDIGPAIEGLADAVRERSGKS